MRGKIPIGVFTVLLILAGYANAALVNWSGSSLLGTGTTLINTSGNLIEAHNTGTSTAVSVAGITFDGLEVNPLGHTITNLIPSSFTGSSAFDLVLNTGSWQYGSNYPSQSTAIPVPYTIDGLQVNHSYLFQAFVADSRVGVNVENRIVTISTGTYGQNQATSGPIGNGWVFTGTFTADSNVQTLIFYGDGASYLNAWQLREVSAVPVPAAVWLLGSGLLSLAVIRRRSK